MLLACLDRESKKQGIVAIRPYKAVVITIHDKEFLFKYYTVLLFFVLKTQSLSKLVVSIATNKLTTLVVNYKAFICGLYQLYTSWIT